VDTAVAASTLEIRTQAAGAGTLLGEMSSNATGRAGWQTLTATQVATPGATEGLFIRRSDDGAGADICLLCRRES